MAEIGARSFRFESVLGIAGIITLVSLFLPWAESGSVSLNGFEVWQGNMTFIGSWLMIIGSMISYGAFNSLTLESLRPWSDLGLGGGGAILVLSGVFAFLHNVPSLFSPAWGVFLAIAGAFSALFSALVLYWEKAGGRTGGL
ncbi:hypothetical protein AKJ44_01335 [candidate division MSBL1 archaeon SCGC-AAA261F17]|uniref:Uncharacterized protein n=1 Tax=candidate division MSBL1 archaeon SCGC-AAA261F17 TaxID=1698274 RepID=A0A133V6S0_9EURY|nr:hypothetical protein AKJ44_01335 [candidate division MSBL1 archaeon SCGC-AAA261F17]